jgi:ABC-2 type transport system ATP-binding protein
MPESAVVFLSMTGVSRTSRTPGCFGMPRGEARRRAHEVLNTSAAARSATAASTSTAAGMRQRIKLASALVHDPALLPARRADQRARLPTAAPRSSRWCAISATPRG